MYVINSSDMYTGEAGVNYLYMTLVFTPGTKKGHGNFINKKCDSHMTNAPKGIGQA